MKRFAIEILDAWKAKSIRKPLVIHGARQVGKTWLMKEFGRKNYKNIAYIWFENNPRMQELFDIDMDVRRILTGLELEIGHKINPKDTLIIFDEIQECPKALTSLKYFNENAPEYDIVAAGSLLGVALHSGLSFPVGKVEFMNMYPLCFGEFLLAMGEEQLYDLLQKRDWNMIKVFKEKFTSLLKMYFYVGGIPEVVLDFSKDRDFNLARKKQIDILNSYQQDFSKHIPINQLQKVRQLWASIPTQLAKDNKKFVYKDVQKGGSASAFEISLGWLESCGLIHKVSRVSKVAQPLKGYENTGAFKLFLCDIGLLSAMSTLDAKIILEGDTLFTEFKGALTEQYACQEMKLFDNAWVSYWTNDGATAEIDFVLQLGAEIMPVEVKAATNLKAKSLTVYREKFAPEITVRTSLADYKKTDNLFDIPLYALGNLKEIIEENKG
ncbi:MAG: ATP-binding protein [Alphaproteobacteria bacterium]|nr:ATP-binding protein [Alphaproteobacteria bacterium]